MSHLLRARHYNQRSRSPPSSSSSEPAQAQANPAEAASRESITASARTARNPLPSNGAKAQPATGVVSPELSSTLPAAPEQDDAATYPPAFAEYAASSSSGSASASAAPPLSSSAILARTLASDRSRRPVPSSSRLSPPADEIGAEAEGTLYASSPHASRDSRRRRFQQRYTDPTRVLLLVLAFGLVAWILPTAWRRGTRGYYTHVHECACAHEHRESSRAHGAAQDSMPWQKEFTLPSMGKGCHLVTDEVEREIAEGLKGCKIGLLTLFIKHTSAALTLNENYDPTVRTDMDMAMDHIVPDKGAIKWEHTDEGPDDSSSHLKSALFGTTVTVPITNGRLNVGTWQGVYLCEWRKMKHSRKVVATILP